MATIFGLGSGEFKGVVCADDPGTIVARFTAALAGSAGFRALMEAERPGRVAGALGPG